MSFTPTGAGFVEIKRYSLSKLRPGLFIDDKVQGRSYFASFRPSWNPLTRDAPSAQVIAGISHLMYERYLAQKAALGEQPDVWVMNMMVCDKILSGGGYNEVQRRVAERNIRNRGPFP